MNRTKIKVHPAAIAIFTEASWEFAHKQLWKNYPFSQAEEQVAKSFISEYYKDILPELFPAFAGKQFYAFCERILKAKRYVERYPSRYIPHPGLYFNPENKKGFAGTLRWYNEDVLREKMKSLRFHFLNGDLIVTRTIYRKTA